MDNKEQLVKETIEMIMNGCEILMRHHLISKHVGVYVGYSKDIISPAKFTVKLPNATSTYSQVKPYVMKAYEEKVSDEVPIRRLALSFEKTSDECCEGYDFFTDWDAVEREKQLQRSCLDIKDKHGKNAVMRGTSYLGEATQRERNTYIGGHRSGNDDKGGTSHAIHGV